MCVGRRLEAERAKQIDLARRVVDVVITADYVRDQHLGIVDDDGEVVSWRSAGPRDDQVVELCVVEDDTALDEIIDDDFAGLWILEAHSGRNVIAPVLAVATTALVTRLAAVRERHCAHLCELLGRAITVIGLALGQ